MDVDIAKEICNSIELIANKRIEEFPRVTTVLATVMKCSNQYTGEYYCYYLGSKITAFSIAPQLKYQNGDNVLILTPFDKKDRNIILRSYGNKLQLDIVAEIEDYLNSDDGKKKINHIITNFLNSDEGDKIIKKKITSYISSTKGTEQLEDIIDNYYNSTLKKKIEKLINEKIDNNE